MARLDEWDVLLRWDSSLFARDSEDRAWIRKRLRASRRTVERLLEMPWNENAPPGVCGLTRGRYR